MFKEKAKPDLFDAAYCLGALQGLRHRYRDLIKDSKPLTDSLDTLQGKLEEVDLIRSEFNTVECREALLDVLERLEEIAEYKQGIYDANPSMPQIDVLHQSLKDFEIKRDFETTLSVLL